MRCFVRRALLFLVLSTVVVVVNGFTAGEVCSSFNYTAGNFGEALRGKHLVLMDVIWVSHLFI